MLQNFFSIFQLVKESSFNHNSIISVSFIYYTTSFHISKGIKAKQNKFHELYIFKESEVFSFVGSIIWQMLQRSSRVIFKANFQSGILKTRRLLWSKERKFQNICSQYSRMHHVLRKVLLMVQ